MLEKRIEELTEVIKELITAIKSSGTTAKSETAAKTEAPAGKPAEDKKPAKGDPAVLKQIQEKGMALIKAGSQEDVKKILKDAGAATFTALKGDKYDEVLAALSKVEPPKADDGPKLDYEKDVKPIAKQVVEGGEESVAKFKELLAKFKVAKGAEVPVAKLGEFLAELNKLVPGKQEDSLV